MTIRKLSLVAALFLAFSFCHAGNFTCDISIGSADAMPSLTFGAGAESLQPFPPFSGQFGVKDFYLVGSGEGDMARLGTDIRANADTWKISCTNSNGSLYFKGDGLPTLYYAYIDPKDSTKEISGVIEDGKLSVKAYTIVTISTSKPTAEPVPEDGRYAEKKSDGTYQTEEKAIAIDLQPTNDIYINAGSADVVVCINGKYYDTNGEIEDFVLKDFVGYVCSFENSKISFKSFANGVLTINGSSTRAADSVKYQVTATKSSLPNLTTTIGNQTYITIIQKFGTLDFDGNGVVNRNDAVFFYNYAMGKKTNKLIRQNAAVTEKFEEEVANVVAFFKENEDDLAELELVEGDVKENKSSELRDSAVFTYNYTMGKKTTKLMSQNTTRQDQTVPQNQEDTLEAKTKIEELIQ